MVSVRAVDSTELFVGPPHAPLQIVRVDYGDAAQPARILIEGDGLTGAADCVEEVLKLNVSGKRST